MDRLSAVARELSGAKGHTLWRTASLQSAQWQNTLKSPSIEPNRNRDFPELKYSSQNWVETNLQGSCLLGVERYSLCSMEMWGFWAIKIVSKSHELFHPSFPHWRLVEVLSPMYSTVMCFPQKWLLGGAWRSSGRREGKGKLNLFLQSIKGEDDFIMISNTKLLHCVFPIGRKRGRWSKKKRCLGCLQSSLEGTKLNLSKIIEEGRRCIKLFWEYL